MAVEYRSSRADWFASEIPLDELARAAHGPDPQAALADLCRRFRSSSITVVTKRNGAPHRLMSAKGAVGTHERFQSATAAGWYVTDHFRNAMSQVAVDDRRPDEAALPEHYIFGAIHADLTYSSSIDRVTNGEIMVINLDDGNQSRQVIDRLVPPAERLNRAAAVERLDDALAEASRFEGIEGRIALLFSGGVDSTVLLTYVHSEATPVTWVPDTPEFTDETEYARAAAAMMNATIQEVPVRESDFLQLLIDTTELIGWPTTHPGTPMFNVVYDLPYDTFVVGEGADALLGVAMRVSKVGGWLANPVGVALLNAAQNKGPRALRHRVDQLHDAAIRLSRPVGPRSYALGNAGSARADEIGRALGSDRVVAALQKRLDFVEERIEIETPPDKGRGRNIEYRHWVYALGDPLVTGRHQAQGRGKGLINPFGSQAVVEAALGVPPGIRYARGLRGKWIAKEVLKKRLPAYPIDQHKKPTAMPFERLYASGPLSDIWDRYDVPAVFTGEAKDEMISGNGLTWQAITYAVWDAHVASNRSLAPHPGSIYAVVS